MRIIILFPSCPVVLAGRVSAAKADWHVLFLSGPIAGILLVGHVGKSTTATEAQGHSEDAEIEPGFAFPNDEKERTPA